MKNTYLTFFFTISTFIFGCSPQQTDIYTEITRPDGSTAKYVNRSSGYGYNPNVTGNINIGGIEGVNNQPVNINTGYYPNYYPTYYNNPFIYQNGCVTVPGAAPIPQNFGIYNYNPTVYWGGYYYRR